MDKLFVIGLDGLKAGRSHFTWHADGKFFGDFENSEILDADLDVDAEVEKTGASILVDSRVKGTVTVACDRCLADLVLPVETGFRLKVRFGEGGEAEEDGREEIVVEDRESGIDLGQVVYDYVYMSLPIQRVHPEGECDPETVKYLSEGEPVEEDPKESSPFAALGMLFNKK